MSSIFPPARPRTLHRRDFQRVRDLVYAEAGIHLADAKHALVESRLARRVLELGLPSYAAYCDLLSKPSSGDERTRMLDCITTNETRFFRESRHFDFLEQIVFPQWRARVAARQMAPRIRAWSAACSTGEEPYTLAMCLLDAFSVGTPWDLEVLASDLSTRALEHARDATWPLDRVREIPSERCRRHMLRGVGPEAGKVRCGRQVRELVRFFRLNLNQPPYAVPGELDLIFCRNVLIYFDAASRARVIDALLDRLAPHGFLFVGHSETLHGVTRRVSLVAPSVYQLRADDRAPRGNAR